MEVFLFFAIVFVLWMIFGASSNHDEAPSSQQDSPKHQNGYNYPLPPPNYPPWEHKPDWKDLEYEYYRVPRIYNYQSVLGVATKSAFATILAVGILILLIYLNVKDNGKGPIGQSEQLGQVQPDRAAIKKPKREHKQNMRHCAKSTLSSDYVTLQKAKDVFPEIEFYYDAAAGQYYAVIYCSQSADLEPLVKTWRKKYMKQFGFNFTHFDVSELCGKNHPSKIVHGDAPYTWVCKACSR